MLIKSALQTYINLQCILFFGKVVSKVEMYALLNCEAAECALAAWAGVLVCVSSNCGSFKFS